MSESIITCNLVVFCCRCVKPEGHVDNNDPIHACEAGCGGSWTGDSEAVMVPVTFPSGVMTGLPNAIANEAIEHLKERQ